MKQIKEYMSIYRNLNGLSQRDKVDYNLFYEWLISEFNLKHILMQCGFRKEADLIRSIEFACKYF